MTAGDLPAPRDGDPGPVEVAPGVMLDFNQEDKVVGVEMLRLSARSSDLDLSSLHVETV